MALSITLLGQDNPPPVRDFRPVRLIRVEPLKMIEEDDKVAVVVRISGTQHGEFMGHTPTGSTFEIEGVDILRIREGKLLEHWGVMDVQRMLAQLRLAPTNVN
jgi:predicted ester cyclase